MAIASIWVASAYVGTVLSFWLAAVADFCFALSSSVLLVYFYLSIWRSQSSIGCRSGLNRCFVLSSSRLSYLSSLSKSVLLWVSRLGFLSSMLFCESSACFALWVSFFLVNSAYSLAISASKALSCFVNSASVIFKIEVLFDNYKDILINLQTNI